MAFVSRIGLAALIGLTACTDGLGPDGEPDFGVHYDIIATATTPSLVEHRIAVRVVYATCDDTPHAFAVHYRVVGSAAEVWLRKRTGYPGCDMGAVQDVEMRLPFPAEVASTVTLVGPAGERFPLRP